MAKGTTTKSQSTRRPEIGTTEPTKRAAKKGVTVADLPARTDRTRSAKGGFTATYQHNQTDLEFVRSKNEVAIETLKIAHEGSSF